MANGSPVQLTKRDRQRAREEAQRRQERRAERTRTLVTVAGLVLIAAVVLGVVLLMGEEDTGVAGPSTAGDVTVEGMPRSAPLQPGEGVPAFTAPDLFGGTVSWQDYLGSPVVLPVWAAWCPHCQAELPVLDRVMKDYPDVGFVSVVTAIGAQDGPTPEQYMQDSQLDFPVAVDDAEQTLAAGLGIQGFPTLYFVNSDGTVAVGLEGEIDEATIRATIESLA